LERGISRWLFGKGVRVLCVLQLFYIWAAGVIRPAVPCRTAFGTVMRCGTRDLIPRTIRFFGIFEPNLTYYTLRRLRACDVYVDIGAHVGYYSLLASRVVGDGGKVIAVEANPDTFAALSANLALNDSGNVEARNIAATATACRVQTRRGDPKNSGSNRIVVGASGVDGLPLRDILGLDLPRSHFIKIDIEGSEAPVLGQILEALDELPARLTVACEISPESAALVARFVAAGFHAYAMPNQYRIEHYLIRAYREQLGYQNEIDIRPVDSYLPGFGDYVFERDERAHG